MGTGTASADPGKLEAAARAVPDELRTALSTGVPELNEKIARFNSGPQSPVRVTVDGDLHAGAMGRALAVGEEIDVRLIRVASAFRIAGGGRPPGFVGPIAPGLMFLDDAALQAEVRRWKDRQPLAPRRRDDGTFEVRGPDGRWYAVRDWPPPGAMALDRTQQVTDFGNPEWGMAVGTAFFLGATGVETDPESRWAPRDAYDHLRLDENGYPVAGPGITGRSPEPGDLPPSDAPPPNMGPRVAAFEGVAALGAGAVEVGKHWDAKHKNILRTQSSFYVDPQTGQRVAVIDAASIHYDNDNNEAIVTSGRLSTDGHGRPRLIRRPDFCPAPGQPQAGPAPELRIPAEEAE
jgi:hypothetical protein